jgi:hypothetical protein
MQIYPGVVKILLCQNQTIGKLLLIGLRSYISYDIQCAYKHREHKLEYVIHLRVAYINIQVYYNICAHIKLYKINQQVPTVN